LCLSSLQYLNLGSVEGSQALPPFLSKLSLLQDLLIENTLKGALSFASLANLTHLRVLDLSHNELTGPLPADVATLSSVRML
jgi:Leucine-rich repeat (LRR) protein